MAVAVKATAVVALPFAMLAPALVRRLPVVRMLARAAGPDLAGGGRASGGPAGGGPARSVLAAAAAAVLAASALARLGFGWVGALSTSDDLRQWTSPPTAVGFVVNYLGQTLVPGVRGGGLDAGAAVLLLALFLVVARFRTIAGFPALPPPVTPPPPGRVRRWCCGGRRWR